MDGDPESTLRIIMNEDVFAVSYLTDVAFITVSRLLFRIVPARGRNQICENATEKPSFSKKYPPFLWELSLCAGNFCSHLDIVIVPQVATCARRLELDERVFPADVPCSRLCTCPLSGQ